MEEEIKTKKKENKLLSFEKGGIIWSVWNFIEAALFLILGILAIVFVCQAGGDKNKLNDMMSTLLDIVGIFLIVGGSLKIIANFMPVFASNHLEAIVKTKIKNELSYDLVIGGSVELAGGIALVAMYSEGLLGDVITFISRFLGLFVGVLLLVAGVSLILFAIAFIVSKLYKIYLPIIEIVFGAVLIALGVVAIIYLQKEEVMAIAVLIVLGAALIISGIALAVVTIRAIKTAHAVHTIVKEAVHANSNNEKITEQKEIEVIEEKKEEEKHDNLDNEKHEN